MESSWSSSCVSNCVLWLVGSKICYSGVVHRRVSGRGLGFGLERGFRNSDFGTSHPEKLKLRSLWFFQMSQLAARWGVRGNGNSQCGISPAQGNEAQTTEPQRRKTPLGSSRSSSRVSNCFLCLVGSKICCSGVARRRVSGRGLGFSSADSPLIMEFEL